MNKGQYKSVWIFLPIILKIINMNKKMIFASLFGAVILGLSAYAGYCTYGVYVDKQTEK